ncbi:MAG: carboxypeptidase regulatory-like domain-containing protein [Acidobacteria bacterium]|nr:carboxypeptidase regulatory-like domain-containing protein [Acidobacteriota bacterium]
MMHILTKAMIVSLLFTFFQPQTPREEYTYIVCGRVVDESGMPVAKARVTFDYGHVAIKGDTSMDSARTDDEGNFCYKETTRAPKLERILYVTGPIPFAKAEVSIYPPFWERPNLIGQQFLGKRIVIKKNGEVNLGDVEVQVYYGIVNVYLQYPDGTPLLTKDAQWEKVWIRVCNEKGQEITYNNLAIAVIERAVNLEQSYIAVGLPEGSYKLEINLKIDPEVSSRTWLRSETLLAISPFNSPQSLILKLPSR